MSRNGTAIPHNTHLLLGRSRLGAQTSALHRCFFLEADWFPLLRCWGTDTYAREQSNRCVSSILLSADVSTSARVSRDRGYTKYQRDKHTGHSKVSSREQATQSTRWMPRCMKPMKDAETGETFGGSCIQAMNP